VDAPILPDECVHSDHRQQMVTQGADGYERRRPGRRMHRRPPPWPQAETVDYQTSDPVW